VYALELRNVSKTYRLYRKPLDRLKEILLRRPLHQAFQPLQSVSFALPHGDILGVVGDNGAGKSTLLKILAGTLQPSQGEVICRGRVAALLELGAGFHPELSGRENIYLNAMVLGLTEAEIRDREAEIIAFSELAEFIDRPVKTYSSGMYVRLAFSVATTVNPEVLIIDEALSVGDQHFQKKCIERMMQFKASGKTILFCSHSLYLVQELCNQAIWLDHGQVRAYGDTATVVGAYMNYLEQREQGNLPADMTQPAALALNSILPDVTIQAIRVTDALGNPLSRAVHAADLWIEIDTRCHRATGFEGHLAVGLFRPDKQLMFGSTTKEAGLSPLHFQGEQRSRLRIPALPLRSGNYFVQGIVGDHTALRPVFELNSEPFTVTSPRPELGLLGLVHEWQPPQSR